MFISFFKKLNYKHSSGVGEVEFLVLFSLSNQTFFHKAVDVFVNHGSGYGNMFSNKDCCLVAVLQCFQYLELGLGHVQAEFGHMDDLIVEIVVYAVYIFLVCYKIQNGPYEFAVCCNVNFVGFIYGPSCDFSQPLAGFNSICCLKLDVLLCNVLIQQACFIVCGIN